MTDSFLNPLMAEALTRHLDQATSTVSKLVTMSGTPAQHFQKNAYAIRISREMALDAGIVEPTAEEKAEREESARKWREKRAEARPGTVAYLAALDGITDRPSRIVLDLHSRGAGHYPECTGCDYEGYESEPPSWPCRTVEAIADHHGIPTPALLVFEEPA